MHSQFNIGLDFSDDPYGRYPEDGPYNGETFREEYLLPRLNKLKDGEKLTIILDDGIESFGSSFLVEGFAGLVKKGHFTSAQLKNNIEFSYTDEVFEFFEKKIWKYIDSSKMEQS